MALGISTDDFLLFFSAVKALPDHCSALDIRPAVTADIGSFSSGLSAAI